MLKKLLVTTALGLVLSGYAMADYAAGQRDYSNGDYSNAFREFQDSANSGDAASQYMLGQLYAGGRGVRQDLVMAHMWYSLAAAWGYDQANGALANVERYMTRDQIAQANEKAKAWHAPNTSSQSNSSYNASYSVLNAQIALNRMGYNAGPADGVMGPKTRDAIRTYQADKGMAVTGQLTRQLFDSMNTGGADNTQTTVSSDVVSNIQSELRRRGYDVPVVSGTLDAKTTQAIRAYQNQSGLRVSGQPSAELLAQLRSSQGTVDVQSQRSLVTTAQAALNNLGYNAGPVDGVFGPSTRSAVRAYQSDNSLPVTGEVTQSLIAQLQSQGSSGQVENQQHDLNLAVEQELAARGYPVGPVDGVVELVHAVRGADLPVGRGHHDRRARRRPAPRPTAQHRPQQRDCPA